MIDYLLASLAAYFIARTVALEDGPFGLCERVRSRIDPEQTTWLGRGVNCPICIGFYVAFLVALLLPATSWQAFLLTWWGLAGAVAVIHSFYLWSVK